MSVEKFLLKKILNNSEIVIDVNLDIISFPCDEYKKLNN